ncbi:hypothetical protein GQ457_06G001090 [Hibiscus cannabinus]
MLWKRRCSLIFSQDVGRFRDVVNLSRNFRDNILAATVNGSVVHTCPRSAARWTLPLVGWIKGNFDGAVGGPHRMAAAGGVLRGGTGEWLFGFSRSLGSCSIIVAELWAVFDLLLHAWRLGFCKVELETDNSLVAEILGRSLALNSNALVSDLKAMIGRRWEVRITHILHEVNRVAKGLASLARGKPRGNGIILFLL